MVLDIYFNWNFYHFTIESKYFLNSSIFILYDD
jgi:hypothetical protein